VEERELDDEVEVGVDEVEVEVVGL